METVACFYTQHDQSSETEQNSKGVAKKPQTMTWKTLNAQYRWAAESGDNSLSVVIPLVFFSVVSPETLIGAALMILFSVLTHPVRAKLAQYAIMVRQTLSSSFVMLPGDGTGGV